MVSPAFYLVGNDLALDFANTVDSPTGNPEGAFTTWKDVSAFLQASGLEAVKAGGSADFDQVLQFRSALRNAFAALEQGYVPARADVQTVNEILRLDAGCEKLVSGPGEWILQRERPYKGALRGLIPVAHAAAVLIAMGHDAAVRKCSNPTCPIYFRDPARRRRWCSMSLCGNRAKVAAHAKRRKEA